MRANYFGKCVMKHITQHKNTIYHKIKDWEESWKTEVQDSLFDELQGAWYWVENIIVSKVILKGGL